MQELKLSTNARSDETVRLQTDAVIGKEALCQD